MEWRRIIETNRRDVCSFDYPDRKAVNEFEKQLNFCAKAWGDAKNIRSKCRI